MAKVVIYTDSTSVIAVTQADLAVYGCPYCGNQTGHVNIYVGGAEVWNCKGCQRATVTLSPGMTRSPIALHRLNGIRVTNEDDFCPQLQDHPLKE